MTQNIQSHDVFTELTIIAGICSVAV